MKIKAFSDYHPVSLMVYFLTVLIITMFVQNPVIQALSFLGALLFCSMLRKRSEIKGNLSFYIPMFLLLAITNPLFSHNGVTPLFFLNGNPVTLEAFIYGIFLAVMIVGVMLWFKCYSEIMTTDKFLYLFGKAIPKLSLVLSMALRFIPMLKRRMHSIKRAQKAMGLYSSKSFVDRIKSSLRVFAGLIAWSLENSMEVSSSMKARGYGLKGRTNFSLFRFKPRDGALLGTSVLMTAFVVTAAAMKYTQFYFYPRITQINLSAFSVIAYTAFAILAFLPFIIEIKESAVWKFYVSKI